MHSPPPRADAAGRARLRARPPVRHGPSSSRSPSSGPPSRPSPAGRVHRRFVGHLRSRTRGQALVEFAIILPVLLFLLVIAIDFGRLFFTYVQVNNAAREAANYGASAPTDTATISARASGEKNSQAQRGENAITVSTSCADATGTTITCAAATGGSGAGNTITVRVNEPFTFLTPIISSVFGSSIQMNASATATVLGYASGGTGTVPTTCTPPSQAAITVTSSGLTITADPNGSAPTTGTCTISGYNWDFGNGDTAVGSTIPVTYTYPTAGTYTITLQVTNQGGALQTTATVTVPAPNPTPTPTPTGNPTPTPTATVAPTPTPGCSKPVAGFTDTKGNPNKRITFTDQSTYQVGCPITNWLWDFGDPNDSTSSNAQNPTHTYPNNNSTYTVTLTVTNSAGSSSITKTIST
jgi:PKD repeat protein